MKNYQYYDQSFSTNNFLKICAYEKERGNDIEKYFLEQEIYEPFSLPLKAIRKKYLESYDKFKSIYKKTKSYEITKPLHERYRKMLSYKYNILKKSKNNKLEEIFDKISINIQNHKYQIHFNIKQFKNKDVYTTEKNLTNFFLFKQLQNNIKKIYNVKQSNRSKILSQLKVILDNDMPKYIIRRDIKSFYENVSSDLILQRLDADALLTNSSRTIIKKIIAEYKKKSKKNTGIPRGIGISAYLSEFYLMSLDSKIKEIPNIHYYGRYVDDIIVILVPDKIKSDIKDYSKKVDEIIKAENFIINDEKDKKQDIDFASNTTFTLNYLGFTFSKKRKDVLKITLSYKKIDKYLIKIEKMFYDYSNNVYRNSRIAFRVLHDRIKYLTGNTRLIGKKGKLMTGIYFSNNILSDTQENHFQKLDEKLQEKIQKFVKNNNHKDKLIQYSFIKGFNQKKLYIFNISKIQRIVKIWKGV